MSKVMRRVALGTAAGLLTVAAAAAPAAAGPVIGQNQSVTYTYYSSSAHTTVVGGYSYGYCGEPFQWGTKTSYFSYFITTC